MFQNDVCVSILLHAALQKSKVPETHLSAFIFLKKLSAVLEQQFVMEASYSPVRRFHAEQEPCRCHWHNADVMEFQN